MPQIDFYFDYSSPYGYLGTTQIEALATRANAALTWRPFFLGGLFRLLDGSLVPLSDASPQKRRWLAQDIQRWAAHWEVPMAWPSRFPMNTIAALRLTLATGCPAPLIHRLMRAYWAEDRDLNDPSVLAACLDACGMDPALLQETRNPAIKTALMDATQAAADAGVFGAPTSVVHHAGKSQLFWGQDRLGFVEKACTGWHVAG